MNNNIIWIDEAGNDVGEVSIAEAHAKGLLHWIAVVYLTNDQNQILIQKRADGWLDHSAAGHVDAGESYQEAAKRELEEELGVRISDLEEIGTCGPSMNGEKVRHQFSVFQCTADPVALDPSEVAEVFWADPMDILKDMEHDTDHKKYCGGFKATLELFLKYNFKVF